MSESKSKLSASVVELRERVRDQAETIAELHEQTEASKAAVRTLEFLNYTYHDSELWQPPIGAKDFGNRAFSWEMLIDVRVFLQECAAAGGQMVNGNRLAVTAGALLAQIGDRNIAQSACKHEYAVMGGGYCSVCGKCGHCGHVPGGSQGD